MHYLGAQSDCISQCPVRTQTMTCERRVHYVQVLVCNNESKTHVGRKKVSVDLQDSDTDVRVVAPAYGVKVTVPPVCKVFKDSFIHRSHVKKNPATLFSLFHHKLETVGQVHRVRERRALRAVLVHAGADLRACEEES